MFAVVSYPVYQCSVRVESIRSVNVFHTLTCLKEKDQQSMMVDDMKLYFSTNLFLLITILLFVYFLQEFSSYNSLAQNQFSQYYALPPSYVPAGLPSSDDQGAGVGAAGYSAVKSEQAASAGLPPRGKLDKIQPVLIL